MQRWSIQKFGGSSVADAPCFRRVAEIVETDSRERLAVVLSACRGVTDQLFGLVASAERRDQPGCADGLALLRNRHVELARDLLPDPAHQSYVAALDTELHDIAHILQTVSLVGASGNNVRDLVAGFGEIWSTRLLATLLEARGRRQPVHWIDAREVITVEWGALGPAVVWEASRANARRVIAADAAGALVVTGYIASDSRGLQTTLGRNGSDFSASILAALLDADEIVIWTDVDGVLSADPRRVPDARVIDALSYDEAMELAYFGAKVIHPQTMAPAVERRIPIRIRNSFAPEKPGTLICAEPASELAIKGITSIDAVALVNLEGAGMIGVPGTAYRLFGALRDAGISVTLISQGSSEHSICFAIPQSQAALADEAVRHAFATELREGQIQSVETCNDCSIIAVVGDGMAGTHGVSAKVFSALGNAAVNVRAIAQGASERNISVVIDGHDATKALRAVHSGFYLSPHTLSIGLIGPGTVGSVLLDQLASQSARLKREFNLDLRVRGIADSQRMTLAESDIEPARWREALLHAEMVDLDRFARHVAAGHLPHWVIIDCTADSGVGMRYASWLAAGIHVVTPNKKANSGPLASYRALHAAGRRSGAHFLYEANVGAGLPVIMTLRDLRETGDEIHAIDGIFSGTLAYVFNVFDGAVPFSRIVNTARAQGYTEPDPRDDLSGMDVARKLIILGREMGLMLELDDVAVESLVPRALRECSIQEYLDGLPEFDGDLQRMLEDARACGQVLRYVGRLSADGRATVGVERLPAGHSFANMALTDNIVRFVTRRYSDNPLVVQGPGAGPAVTAGGVFGDLLRLAAYLGARL